MAKAKKSISDKELVDVITEYYCEADTAKKGGVFDRYEKDKLNMNSYFSKQNWDHKIEGQSKEFIPLTSSAVDMMAAFLKKATTSSGDWFDVDSVTPDVLDSPSLRKFVRFFLEKAQFSTVLEDSVKVAQLRSLGLFKIHGKFTNERIPIGVKKKDGTLEFKSVRKWTPVIDLIDPASYFPDPTGRNLYVIHEVKRDISAVQAMVRSESNPLGIYDAKEVAKLKETHSHTDGEKDYDEEVVYADQNQTTRPAFRKEVILWEFFGTVLGKNGQVIAESSICTIANEKHVIRKLQPNPWWHGKVPIVEMPLVRVPFSKWHKALQDDPVRMNLAANEIYNLMFDGAMESVHGMKQVREGMMENPEDYTDGIPVNANILIKDEAPMGIKVVESLVTGGVPTDANNMLNLITQYQSQASLINDIKKGVLPQRAVKATEIVEATQQVAVGIDDIALRVEKATEEVISLFTMNLFQHLGTDDILDGDVAALIGQEKMDQLAKMTPEERYFAFYGGRLKVFGFSSVVNRLKDYQKLIAYNEVINSDPELKADSDLRLSPEKKHNFILKNLNIDVTQLERDPEDRAAKEEELAQQAEEERIDFPADEGGSPSAALKGLQRDITTDETFPSGKEALGGSI